MQPTPLIAHGLKRPNLIAVNSYGKDGWPWTAEEDALLGTSTDRVIAAKLGRSSVSVSNRRKKLGIRAPSRSRPDVLPLSRRAV